MVPTHSVVAMRRPPHISRAALALLAISAVIAASCASTSFEERALIDESLESFNVTPLVQDEFDDPDPFGLEVDRTPAANPGSGIVERATAPAGIEQFGCPFDIDNLAPARCGRIELPGRGADAGYTVEIAFARFVATGDEEDLQNDPVVYLHGGPGGSILDDADYWYDSIVAPHIEHRDVILYDQRGGGRSTKLPACTEATTSTDAFFEEPAPHDELAAPFLTALAKCADRLAQRRGVDLTAYSSAANAQDLVDLMWALGVQTYNLHGSSYGTRIAQTVLRDNPAGIRSVTLSGVYPIAENLMGSIPQSLEASLDHVFTACANTQACNDALPDPWRALEDLVSRLDERPLSFTLGSGIGSWALHFAGTDLLNGIHNFVYVGSDAVSIPDLLIDERDGDDRRLRRLAATSVFSSVDVAPFVLVQCADEARFTTPDQLNRQIDHPFLNATDAAPSLNGRDALTICDSWDHAETPAHENDVVTWETPTLLLSGALDPITPQWWAESLASELPNARLVRFAGASHDSDEGSCAINIIGAFVETPEVPPAAGCAVGPPLTVPTRAERFRQPLSFDQWTFDLDADGEFVDGQVPAWDPVYFDDVQIFWRNLDSLDPTSIVVVPNGNTYDAMSHLVIYEVEPEWRLDGHSLVDGWSRESVSLQTGDLVRYVNDVSGVQVVLVTESGEPRDLETTILAVVAESLGAGQ
jgi:pimeloyl-ACP methyl ester carboxylesterase